MGKIQVGLNVFWPVRKTSFLEIGYKLRTFDMYSRIIKHQEFLLQ